MPLPELPSPAQLSWTEHGVEHRADWRAENGAPPPRRVVRADDSMNADTAYRLACEGTALLWRGDFQNARQLLQAMARRIDRRPASKKAPAGGKTPPAFPEAFHLHRQARAQRARTLGMLLIPVEPGHIVPLRRAPDVALACQDVYGPAGEPYVTSLRELLGLVGARQWREKGVEIPALGDRIIPHYGVYSPVRGEYLDLVAQAPLPGTALAFDIGTGTGVIAALLARRGVRQVVATDQDARALACARENLARLGVAGQVHLARVDLFPPGQAQLVVCNPPWVPARATAPIEQAVYDPESRMLRGFLDGLAEHLAPDGEGWLILSDLAERLQLRSREALLAWIDAAGLCVADKMDIRPRHGKAQDADDPLHAARAAEVTSLWRLRHKSPLPARGI
ncbi:methylase [Bordetella sp. H567]|uniref:methyltransferase n=1 Tax=Bordetella sp. H567 TaxID=1697043 RepID=UPI00081D2118|nr:class I SAM-dependent methyltransferase [Bordetella sp. H567]AOB32523.1 methylase [Bordetella sp. H567]